MDCCRFEEQLTDYLDKQLAPASAALFASHALQCRDCRQLLEEVRAAVKECRQDEEIQTPAGLEATLSRIAVEHKPIDCATFEEIITEFLDGFVPAAVYHRFETHSADCQNCSTLLTDVVYAVAACHSVHTYEYYEIPQGLSERLKSLMPAGRRSLTRAFRDGAVALMSRLIPAATQGAAWSFTTASMLFFATCGLLLFGFSDDRTVGGIYRQAHVKAAELYSQGAGIYAQKHDVVARLQVVSSNLGEIWSTLGGESQSETGTDTQKTPDKTTESSTAQ